MSTTKVQSDMVDIDGATTATIVAGDKINFLDITDSLVKEDTVQGILDLAGGGFTLATEQATTSGTSITFGSIPSGTTKIVVMLEGVSFGTENSVLLQLGDSGGIETGSYISVGLRPKNGVLAGGTTRTDGFHTASDGTSDNMTFTYELNLKDSSNFTWIGSWAGCMASGTTSATLGGGSKSLSAELTQLKLSGHTGATFDAGSVNIMYQ
jgi:hypothetical protein